MKEMTDAEIARLRANVDQALARLEAVWEKAKAQLAKVMADLKKARGEERE